MDLPVTPDGNLAAGAQSRIYLKTPYNEGSGRFAPEVPPHWVAYQSDETGRSEIYLQSFPEARAAKRVSTGGGANPHWSSDGRELFYVGPQNKLMVVSVTLGADSVQVSTARKLFTLPSGNFEIHPDGKRFIVPAPAPPEPLTLIVNWQALLKK